MLTKGRSNGQPMPSAKYIPDLTLRIRFTAPRPPHQALRPFLHNVMEVEYADRLAPVFYFTLTAVLAN